MFWVRETQRLLAATQPNPLPIPFLIRRCAQQWRTILFLPRGVNSFFFFSRSTTAPTRSMFACVTPAVNENTPISDVLRVFMSRNQLADPIDRDVTPRDTTTNSFVPRFYFLLILLPTQLIFLFISCTEKLVGTPRFVVCWFLISQSAPIGTFLF